MVKYIVIKVRKNVLFEKLKEKFVSPEEYFLGPIDQMP
jgi:hypothetical protein